MQTLLFHYQDQVNIRLSFTGMCTLIDNTLTVLS